MFLKYLPAFTTNDDLRRVAERYGRVLEANVWTVDRDIPLNGYLPSRRSRGTNTASSNARTITYGTVEYSTMEEMLKAIDHFHGRELVRGDRHDPETGAIKAFVSAGIEGPPKTSLRTEEDDPDDPPCAAPFWPPPKSLDLDP